MRFSRKFGNLAFNHSFLNIYSATSHLIHNISRNLATAIEGLESRRRSSRQGVCANFGNSAFIPVYYRRLCNAALNQTFSRIFGNVAFNWGFSRKFGNAASNRRFPRSPVHDPLLRTCALISVIVRLLTFFSVHYATQRLFRYFSRSLDNAAFKQQFSRRFGNVVNDKLRQISYSTMYVQKRLWKILPIFKAHSKHPKYSLCLTNRGIQAI